MSHSLFGLWRCGLKHEPYQCNAVKVKKSYLLVDEKRVSNLAEYCSGNS